MTARKPISDYRVPYLTGNADGVVVTMPGYPPTSRPTVEEAVNLVAERTGKPA